MTGAMTTAAVLAFLVGVVMGLLGGGGSVLLVPILVHVVGLRAKVAIPTSLLVVAAASFTAFVSHARAGRVRWRTGLLVALAAMAGAFAGGLSSRWFHEAVLLLLFAALMIAAAVVMIRPRGEAPARPPGEPRRRPPVVRVLLVGLVMGALSGLAGVSGAFMLVPALALFLGLPMGEAVGTTLLIATLTSLAGFAGHAGHAPIEWPLVALTGTAALAGSIGGSRLVSHVSQPILRRVFGWFILGMAGYMIVDLVRALL